MSMTGLSDPEKMYKKTFHRRDDSGELDVFEAARYFSGATEVISGYNNGGIATTFAQKQGWRSGRISLDMPMRGLIPPQSHVIEKQTKDKKHKQPSSPGGRLASFLNSLFNQTSSKKKKSSKSTTQSMKDEDESPGGRRKRRSSISHFRSSSSTTDSKSIYSSSSSGFRTPPPYSHAPAAKIYKDLRSFSDHKQVLPLPKYNGQAKPTNGLEDKLKINNGSPEKVKNSGKGFPEKDRILAEKHPSAEKEFSKFYEVDDGAESDSSSDLFELENYDLGYYSSGLPVYETTHLEHIKIGAPISNGAM